MRKVISFIRRLPSSKLGNILRLFYHKISGYTVIVYTKNHPIYSDFFENYSGDKYRFVYLTKDSFFIKFCDIIHSDAFSYNQKWEVLNKPIVVECEALAKSSFFDNSKINSVIFQSLFASRKQFSQNKASNVYPAVKERLTIADFLNKSKNINGDIILLTVGFGSYIKGYDVSFEIFKRLKKNGYPVKLILAGALGHNFIHYPEVTKEAYDRAGFDRLISYSKSNSDLIIKSFSRNELLKDIYSKADILLQFSRMETFGFSILEAMSFGLPIVSVNFKAIPELVKHGYNGYLVDSFHWEEGNEIEERVMLKNDWFVKSTEDGYHFSEMLCDSKERRIEMGLNSLKIVNKKFSLENRHLALDKIYSSIFDNE